LDSPHEKSLRPGVSFALICQALSPRAQTYCIEQGIDFIDLAGNISINVPGEFTLQRLGKRTNRRTGESASPVFPNVFSGRYSRVGQFPITRMISTGRPHTNLEPTSH
jgi:hypothetical protein